MAWPVPDMHLLAQYLNGNLSGPGAIIEIYEDYLLPGAQSQPFVDKRYCQRSAKCGSADVGMAVAVRPSLVMRIGDVPGYHPIPHILEIGK